ncbi:MAG: GtrA family protein [Hominilimicola sp.]
MDKVLSDLRVKLSRHLPPGVMRAVRPFLTVQFIIFMIMGIINTAVSVFTASLLDILHRNFISSDNIIRAMAEHLRSNFIFGYIVSIVTSFFLNCKFTFRQKPTWEKFIKFPISYIPNFIFQYIIVFIFTSLHWNSTVAYICAAIIGTPLTFAAMKLMVFRRKKTT